MIHLSREINITQKYPPTVGCIYHIGCQERILLKIKGVLLFRDTQYTFHLIMVAIWKSFREIGMNKFCGW